MKRLYLTVFLIFAAVQVFAQTPHHIDSIRTVFNKTTDPLKRFKSCVFFASFYITNGKLDSVPKYNAELFKIAAQQKNDSLLMVSYQSISRYYDFKTDTKPELEYDFKALKIAEKQYPDALPRIYLGLTSAYLDIPNYEATVKYATMSLATGNHSHKSFKLLYAYLSEAYLGLGRLDSALHYIQKCNEYLIKSPDNKIVNTLFYALTGKVYERLGQLKLARSYYEQGIDPDANIRSRYEDAYALGAYSIFLLKQKDFENAKRYGLEGLTTARKSQAKKPFLSIVENLRKTYDALGQQDSAYYFAKLELTYRDSLFNQEKLNAVQDMTINEDIRQKEESIKQAEAATEHQHNVQYTAIAIGLITFIVLVILFSRTIYFSAKFIEFFGVLGLLAVFEFINLFIHPYLEEITHHLPALMLLVLIALAALLVPLHHKLEKRMMQIMVEKNKKIRLAAAKKTVAMLEREEHKPIA
jgi:tetratricopeptide (TPR) repeat protein